VKYLEIIFQCDDTSVRKLQVHQSAREKLADFIVIRSLANETEKKSTRKNYNSFTD
jgi:hypothetical protein